MKKKRILPINLSKYSNERKPGNIVSIIVNMLIQTSANIKKVSQLTSLPENDILEIFENYYPYIDSIIEGEEYNNEIDKCINDSIEIIQKHIEEIKSKQIKSNSKILSNSGDITKVLDRIINIKENSIKSFDTKYNKLNDMIIKYQTLAKLENGEIENNSDYMENQTTVFDMLNNSINNPDRKSRKVKITNIKTKEIKEFISIKECADFLNADSVYIGKINGRVYAKEWLIEIQ